MQNKILLIDFGYPFISNIAQIIRYWGAFSEIVNSQDMIHFTPEIKGIIFLGNTKTDSLNLNSIEVPILGIEQGAWILATSCEALLSPSIIEINEKDISQNWILVKPRDHPLLIGLNHSHLINCKRIRNINNVENLCINQKGMTTAFQIFGKPFYGLQFWPDKNNLIWKNFLHLCKFPLEWNMHYFLSQVKKELIYKIGTKTVLIPYSGGLRSTILLYLLSQTLPPNQIKAVSIKTGLSRLNDHPQTWNNISITEIDKTKECLEVVNTLDETNRIDGIWNIIINSCHCEYHYLLDSKLIDSYDKTWEIGRDVQILQPFSFLYRNELKELGRILGVNDKILNQHPFPPEGFVSRIVGEITTTKITLLQAIDYYWIRFLQEEYYYNQIYSAGASWLSDTIISLWAWDEEDKMATISMDLILKIVLKIKDELNLNDVELVYSLKNN